GLATPLAASRELPHAIVQYVARSQETVVLSNAADASRFASEPYLVARRPRSVLCLALSHQGRLTGALYLENNAVDDAFTPARVELLRVLAAQAAIAVENARLYARV